MRLSVPQTQVRSLKIELAPLRRDSLSSLVSPGLQSHIVARYWGAESAPTIEDEVWRYDYIRTSKSTMTWGIWLNEGSRKLIGLTNFHKIEHGRTGLKQARSATLISNRAYWGRGIATRVNMARTWFGFTELGITRIRSSVAQSNIASRKALEHCGYVHIGVERNAGYSDGALYHEDKFECVNPLDPFWSTWWGSDEPPQQSARARAVSNGAIEWAKANIELP